VEHVKKLTVIAIFSDELLVQRFVLKGGNAMDLILKVSSRASMDIDLSMSNDFPVEELAEVTTRISRGLDGAFLPEGITPFDIVLEDKPSEVTPDLV
jgi:predicted nucleotidyltransferase component of viral defense system